MLALRVCIRQRLLPETLCVYHECMSDVYVDSRNKPLGICLLCNIPVLRYLDKIESLSEIQISSSSGLRGLIKSTRKVCLKRKVRNGSSPSCVIKIVATKNSPHTTFQATATKVH
ncbi:unnamed protein product [Ceratitis capitata]|uniref:(Mediterranean fruit fly) hypothetical protein n=1 Tax=Ceratitis capitata TaxID=7213 RepID=A0A811UCW7_CERCA|nr:unnamed protein product [Ceratitis capitata]